MMFPWSRYSPSQGSVLSLKSTGLLASHEPGLLFGRFCEDSHIRLLGNLPQLLGGEGALGPRFWRGGAQVPLLSRQVALGAALRSSRPSSRDKCGGNTTPQSPSSFFPVLSPRLLPPCYPPGERMMRGVEHLALTWPHVTVTVGVAWPRGTSGPAYRLLGHPVQPSLVQEQGLWKCLQPGRRGFAGVGTPHAGSCVGLMGSCRPGQSRWSVQQEVGSCLGFASAMCPMR